MRRDLRLSFRCELSDISRRTPEIERFLHGSGVSEETAYVVHLVVEEAVSNAIRHGRRNGDDSAIALLLLVTDDAVTVTVEDGGIAFDPTLAPEPDAPAEIEQWQVGGLGLKLIRRLAADWKYERVGNRNRFQVRVARAPA